MDALGFGIEVVAVSASGVLTPGPLFVANVLYGGGCGGNSRRGAVSGIKVAHGHAIVEIIIISAIAAGLFSAPVFVPGYTGTIALVGGAAILGFAALQVIGIARNNDVKEPILVKRKSPFVIGVALSALNPFFIIWWLTVGLKLVADSAMFGLVAGVVVLFALHVWMDYVWLAATAYLASKGSSAIKSKYYKILMMALSGVLVYYGMQFLMAGI
ncbi:MAG: LysE family transporter [Nitrososphaera sp.]